MARRIGIRDTAKDIMLGTAPSGLGPKMPRDAALRRPRPHNPESRPLPSISPSIPAPPDPQIQPVMDPIVIARISSAERSNRTLLEELRKLQNDFAQFQRHYSDAISEEQEARKRLEAALRASNNMNARMIEEINAGNGTAGEKQEMKRAQAELEADLFRTKQELAHLKSVADDQSNDLITLNNELKSRPVIDPSHMTNSEHLESVIRDVHGQLMGLRQALENEGQDRKKNNNTHDFLLKRLQDQMEEHDARKNEILMALAAHEGTKNAVTEEARRLNSKIGYITDAVTANMMAKEQQLREEMEQHYLVLEKAIKAELESRLQFERDIKLYIDQRWNYFQEQLDQLNHVIYQEKDKRKHQIAKLNEDISMTNSHLEQGNGKVDRVLAAEIEARRSHCRELLAKLGEIEDRLNMHVNQVINALDDVREGLKVEPSTPIDIEALRNELDAIASDKQKLSMEGLLKLEERMNRMEENINRDTKELKEKLDNLDQDHNNFKNSVDAKYKAHEDGRQFDQDSVARIRHQIQKLEDAHQEIGRTHDKLKDRVDGELPKNVEELDMKAKQRHDELRDRLDNEEQERSDAIRNLQDEITTLKNQTAHTFHTPVDAGTRGHVTEKVQKDLDDCKIGIKKLAESVTTVKNVLERKIAEETKTREKEIDEVHKRIESLND